jgi:hypothetical protein
VARGDHPKRTVFYGVCLMAFAFLAIWPAASVHSTWLSVLIYVVAVIAGLVGSVMALRDYG